VTLSDGFWCLVLGDQGKIVLGRVAVLVEVFPVDAVLVSVGSAINVGCHLGSIVDFATQELRVTAACEQHA